MFYFNLDIKHLSVRHKHINIIYHNFNVFNVISVDFTSVIPVISGVISVNPVISVILCTAYQVVSKFKGITVYYRLGQISQMG